MQESVTLVLPGQELGNRELRLEPGLGYTSKISDLPPLTRAHSLKALPLP